MSRPKLKNAPLREVIFELLWKLPVNEAGMAFDPSFELALGHYSSSMKRRFPIRKRTVPDGFPVRAYKPLHQFWSGELRWPVVQFGPGLLTVNDTDVNYSWLGNYRDNLAFAIDVLWESYGQEGGTLEVEKVRLTYVDAVEYDCEKETASEFVARNLNTELVCAYPLPGKPIDLNIAQGFELSEKSKMLITIQNGEHHQTGRPAIIWTTAVEKVENIAKEDLLHWLDFAHDLSSNTFVNMLNPDFYGSFGD